MIFEGSPDAIFISDADSRFVDVNPSATTLTGYSREELLSMRIPDLHEEIDLDAYRIHHNRIMEGSPAVTEARITRKDKTKIDTEFNNRRILIDGVPFMHTVARDISSRMRMESTLAESEHFIERILAATPGLVYIYDLARSAIIYMNPNASSFLGLSTESASQTGMKHFLEWFHPDDREWIANYLSQWYYIQEDTVQSNEWRMKDKNGQWHWFDARDTAFRRNPDGSVLQVIGIAQEITQRKRTEESLRESETKFRRIIESSPFGIHHYQLLADDRLVFLEGNRIADRILGVDHRRFCGKTIEDAFPSLAATEIPERYRDTAKTGTPWKSEQIDYHDDQISGAFEVHAFQTIPGEVVVMFQDISDRLRSQEELRTSRENYHTLFFNAQEGIFQSTPGGRFLSVNPACARMAGFSSPEQMIMETTDIGHQLYADPGERQKLMQTLESEGSVSGFEFRFYTKQKEIKWGALDVTAFRNSGGTIVRYDGLIQDITERKRIEAELRESETRFRTAFNEAPIGMALTSPKGTFIMVNQKFVSMIGRSEEEIVDHHFNDFTHADDREIGQSMTQEVLEGETYAMHLEKRYIHRDGRVIWAEVKAELIRDLQYRPLYFIVHIHDISERKAAEAALRESEARFRILFEHSPLGICITRRGKILYTNGAFLGLFGFDDIIQVYDGLFRDIVISTRRTETGDCLNAVEAAAEQSPLTYESVGLRRNGDSFPFLMEIARIELPGGAATISFISDISEREKTEAALRESEERYRSLAEVSPDFIFIVGADGRVQYVNERSAVEFNRPVGELVGRRLSDLFPAATSQRHAEKIRKVMETGQPEYSENITDFPSGPRVLDTWLVPLQTGPTGQKSVLGISRDISQRKQAEDQVRRSLREKEILLRELKHRVKNNLQTIDSLITLKFEELKDPRLLRVQDDIHAKIQAMALIFQHLQSEADMGAIPADTYLEQLLASISESFSPLARGIAVVLTTDSIHLGVDQLFPLGLIVNELVCNAYKHAFTAEQKKKRIDVSLRALKPVEIRLTVADNGCGIDPSVNRDDSRSLGLKLVSSLVDQIDGKMERAEGKGTRFIIDFPLTKTQGLHE